MQSDVVILAGGRGTRLSSLSSGLPKALIPIHRGEPFLHYLLQWLEHAGVRRVRLSLCYRPELFEDFLLRTSWPFEIETIVEPEPLGTGGAIGHVIQAAALTECFAVVNGDTLVDFDLCEMERFVLSRDEPASVGVSYVEDTTRYGQVRIENGLVVDLVEKAQSLGSGWINNGCYFLSRGLFAAKEWKFSIETKLLPDLALRGQLGAYETTGLFIDVGVPEDFARFSTIAARFTGMQKDSKRGMV